MNNSLRVFKSEKFGTIRTITENGKTLFCGTDIAQSLGYTNPRKAVRDHCKGGTKRSIGVPTGRRADGTPAMQSVEMTFIPEGDIYRLAAKSQLPGADEFESWIFDEVLVTINHTGGFVATEEFFVNSYFPNADERTKQFLIASLNETKKLNAKIAADAPKVLFADSVGASEDGILIRDLAKLLQQNGIDIGEKRLFVWLREHGYLIKKGSDRNMPTQYSMERGLFRIVESTRTSPDHPPKIFRTPRVTGKGQQYFLDKFLRGEAA